MKVEREAQEVARARARQYRVVTIIGARQSGKTTLCRMAFGDRPYYSLENPDTREIIESDPVSFLERHRKTGVILDEIQNLPMLLSHIQGIVDEDEMPGQFILTGSHQFSLMQGITQSLAGRTTLIHLLPFSFSETEKFRPLSQPDDYLLAGFYPGLWNRNLEPTPFYRDYFETYVQRDVRQMLQVKDLRTFRNFVRLCAGRIGQLFNASDIGNNLGVSGHTVKSWISVLEASQILYLMEPFFANLGKRLIKSPKIYFHDVGLAAYLLGFTSTDQLYTDRMRGPLFENMVVSEILKTACNQNRDYRLAFYRDKQQHEVDVMVPAGRKYDCVEIKSSATFHKDYLKELNDFASAHPEICGERSLVFAGKTAPSVQGVNVLNYKDAGRILPA